MAKENDNTTCDHEFDIITLKTELAEQKKKVDEFTNQNADLAAKLDESNKKLKEATDTLTTYINAEKKHLVEDIAKRSDLKAEELDKKEIGELRIIQTAIDHVKVEGTVKSVRSAGTDKTHEIPASALTGSVTARMSVGRPKKNADGSIEWVVE